MAAQRKQSPSGSPPFGTDLNSRGHTPLPESRQRSTESGLDAREVGTRREQDDLSPSPGPELGALGAEKRTDRWSSALPPPDEGSREAITEPAGAPSQRPSMSYGLPPSDKFTVSPTESVGYYSLRPEEVDAVQIPRAPRVPLLDIGDDEKTSPQTPSSRPELLRSASVPPSSLRNGSAAEAPVPAFAQAPETIRTPPPSLSPRRRRASTPPPPMQESRAPELPEPQGFDTLPPPRIYFAEHVRAQANQWAQTGSLSLPGCASPRHARALQRALLLALLHQPGWDAIPQGLRQRAGWLFCEGWEAGDGHAHPLREIDDLATVLGLPCNEETRETLSWAIHGVMPAEHTVRARSSAPPPVHAR